MAVALITGGRKGIGRAFTEALIRRGDSVVVIANSTDSNNLDCKYISCDLSVPIKRIKLIDRIFEEYGRIDILINNAGCQHHAGASEYPATAWNNDIELMLTAPFDLCQQAFPYMKKQGYGRIINMASIVSFQGARNIIGYVTVKHGLVGLTRCLSSEWAKHGITVNSIAPGVINTEMTSHLNNAPAQIKEITGRIPIGKIGQPDDVVGAMLFLCSDGASYITGQTLIVDGGWAAR